MLSVEGVKLNFQVAKLGEVADLRVWEEGISCKQAQRLKPGTKRFTVASNVESVAIGVLCHFFSSGYSILYSFSMSL